MKATALPLQGKVAVVTGAGRGIGKAIAVAFAHAGAKVCCSARSEEQIAAVVAGLKADGAEAMHHAADVADPAAVDRLFQATRERFGGIDLVVANAGHEADSAAVADSDPASWKLIIETNLVGAYYTMRAAIPYLQERGAGKIIAIGSGAGHHGVPGSSAYSCAKAGLWMLVRVLGQELASLDISVNEINPGPVDTEMLHMGAGAANLALIRQVEWYKKPEEVAPLALFLAAQPNRGPTSQSYSLLRRG